MTEKPIFENRTALDRSGKVQIKLVPILILCLAPAAFSEDFKTVNGKEYKDASITRVDPDGIVVKTTFGVSKGLLC